MTKRTLTLIRHAKSSWNNPSLSDFERPLNKRGTHDAPRVGAALQQADISFDRVLCSDAQRARQTLTLLGQGIEVNEGIIEYRHDLYGASANHLLTCVKEQSDSINNLALVGHNPGMEDLADMLAGSPPGLMPTCCVIHLVYECESWCDLFQAQGEVALQISPRDL